jgi:hypothetical protein
MAATPPIALTAAILTRADGEAEWDLLSEELELFTVR